MDIEDTMTVFIGHGHSPIWRELKDFLQDQLSLKVDEFNRISAAGISTTSRLGEMLDNASFAFLIMTAEDEQADGKRYARLNVVHEAGLFQGRLGFQKAIILLEEGCEDFSNVDGLGRIEFPKGTISAKFEQIRAVLDREAGRPSQQAGGANIRVVDITVPSPNPDRNLVYPLKCYVELRNDSAKCADVSVSEYRPQTVTLKKFAPDVLQVKIREWSPQLHGVDRLAVLPGQLFRAWVGIDEKKFNENQIRGLRGKIGTLLLSVNGKPVAIPL